MRMARFPLPLPIAIGLGLALALGAPLHAQMFRLEEATIDQVHQAMAAGTLTCRQLVQGYLDRIAAYDGRGPRLNAIHTVNPRALQEADRLDAARRAGSPMPPLHCVPVLLKDQVETSDMPTTYGSALFTAFVPKRNATAVIRMKAAGAIILAKTNMGEFALRYVDSGAGVIHNAYDPTRNPSGSSGGTGAGIAANFGLVGIGEDTGGSIRGPAAVHSLVGLRPTVPLVSRFGMLPVNPSTDTMGPLARTVRDAAILLGVLVGYDPADPVTAWSVGHVPDSYVAGLAADGLRGVRLGVLREPMDRRVDTTSAGFREVRAQIERALGQLRAQGAEIVDVSIPGLDRVGALYSSNVYETEAATDAYLKEHPDAPYKTLRAMLLSGKMNSWRAVAFASALGHTTRDPGYLDYVNAREQLRTTVLQAMADRRLDAIVYATFDFPPTPIAADVETNPAPKDDYGFGDNRTLSPVLGFPALTVPAGFTSEGLPVGLELLGRPFTEADLLRWAYAFEQATHHRKPPATTPPLGR
ncbi:MAG: amidase [Gemmatimonadetes bacterium]|nr:amidase [Gemmatimonadota bacterium]